MLDGKGLVPGFGGPNDFSGPSLRPKNKDKPAMDSVKTLIFLEGGMDRFLWLSDRSDSMTLES